MYLNKGLFQEVLKIICGYFDTQNIFQTATILCILLNMFLFRQATQMVNTINSHAL